MDGIVFGFTYLIDFIVMKERIRLKAAFCKHEDIFNVAHAKGMIQNIVQSVHLFCR